MLGWALSVATTSTLAHSGGVPAGIPLRSLRPDLLHDVTELLVRAGRHAGGRVWPGEAPRHDLVARKRNEDVVRGRAGPGRERETHLGVDDAGRAAAVLVVEAVGAAEQLAELFLEIGIEHLRLRENAEAVKARSVGSGRCRGGG